MGIIASDGKWCLSLVFSEMWEVPWPRPESTQPSVRLQIQRDGSFSLDAWIVALQTAPAHEKQVGNVWLRALQVRLGPIPRLSELIAATGSMKKLASLHRQILWKTGFWLQSVMKASLKGQKQRGLECVPWRMADLLEQPYQLDKYLVRYASAALRRLQPQIHFTICTDKASVGGLALQNTFVCTPDGVAVMAPPQAPLGGSGGVWGRLPAGPPTEQIPGPRIALGDVIWGPFFRMSRVAGIT